MKASNFNLVRYDADEGKLFDWKEPRYVEDAEGNQVQEHLNVKTLFIGANDTVENYIEVDDEGNATELTTPEFASLYDYEAVLADLGV